MRKLSFLAFAAAMVAAPVQAATTIDFSGHSGTYASGGLTIGGLTFSNANGTDMEVADFGAQSDGEGLAIFSDADGNFLIADLASIATSISLDFGNDDPFFTNPGDLAVLQLFLGGVLVDTVQVVLNPDDIMNQTISYAGGAFDRFTFAFTNAAGAPFTGGGQKNVGLIEIVDNIRLNVGAVPEPSTWAMMLLGFGAVGFSVRRNKKKARIAQTAVAA
jgi:hypothetical protein